MKVSHLTILRKLLLILTLTLDLRNQIKGFAFEINLSRKGVGVKSPMETHNE